jgi:hypothetical protein
MQLSAIKHHLKDVTFQGRGNVGPNDVTDQLDSELQRAERRLLRSQLYGPEKELERVPVSQNVDDTAFRLLQSLQRHGFVPEEQRIEIPPALIQAAAALGLKVVNVPGDGACQSRSISIAMGGVFSHLPGARSNGNSAHLQQGASCTCARLSSHWNRRWHSG